MDNKNLATFRLSQQTWKQFQEKARQDGSNASALLKRFVELYLDDRIDLDIDGKLEVSRTDLERYVDTRVGEVVEAALGKSSWIWR